MDWSPQQARALDAVGGWLRDPSGPQIFRLWGYAGTGKTTLARHLAEGVDDGEVLFAAYCGKAAEVMRRRGCHGATTLHSIVYRPRDKSRRRLRRLQEELARAPSPELEREIAAEERSLRAPAFELDREAPLAGARLLVLDEGSMVGQALGEDVLSFGVRVLVLGDPFQLPPVMGAGFFTDHRPDALLTEIHRQARDDPIVGMATDIREGRGLTYGRRGGSSVIRVAELDRDAIPRGTQIVVGRNETRRRANARRRASLGMAGPVCAGDRVVCLRNDHGLGLLNGAVWDVTAAEVDEPTVTLGLRDPDGGGPPLEVEAHLDPFLGREVPLARRMAAQEFDHGYALTCHKAQGSEWDDVLVVDESRVFGRNAARWRYTAITRAKQTVTVVM